VEGFANLETGAVANHLLKFVVTFPKKTEVSKPVALAVERIKELATSNRRFASAQELQQLTRDPFKLPRF